MTKPVMCADSGSRAVLSVVVPFVLLCLSLFEVANVPGFNRLIGANFPLHNGANADCLHCRAILVTIILTAGKPRIYHC